jgi:membrane-associated protease RseP (regulator of RpoE activity)
MKHTIRTLLLSSLLTLSASVASAAPAAAPPPTPPPAAPQVHTFSYSFGFGHGRLGVQVSSMTTELRTFFGAPDDAGILVQRVEPGSAAADAGVAVGDVIVEVDGDRVDEVSDVREALSDRDKGTRVSMTVVRNKKKKKLAATMTNDPVGSVFGSSGPGPSGVPSLLVPPSADPQMQQMLEEMRKRMDQMEQQLRQQPRGKGKTRSQPPRRRPRSAA